MKLWICASCVAASSRSCEISSMGTPSAMFSATPVAVMKTSCGT